MIEDAADDDLLAAGELARFDRQLRYFSDIGTRRADARRSASGGCARRRWRCSGVGGLGGSAAWCAGLLSASARCG